MQTTSYTLVNHHRLPHHLVPNRAVTVQAVQGFPMSSMFLLASDSTIQHMTRDTQFARCMSADAAKTHTARPRAGRLAQGKPISLLSARLTQGVDTMDVYRLVPSPSFEARLAARKNANTIVESAFVLSFERPQYEDEDIEPQLCP